MSDASRAEALIELAAVVRAHGLAGEVVLKSFNPASDLLSSLNEVSLRSPEGVVTTYAVVSRRGGGDSLLIGLRGVNDRDQAEALRGSLVCVPRAVLPPLEDGEYYLADLTGLAVRDTAGNTIGHVDDVLEYPSVEALVVLVEGIVREVPNLDRYVPEVNVSGGFVVVDHLDEIEPVPLAALKGKKR
ncbi:MAG: ribosome maturation factor RimM [Polyangiales bacterium]